VDERGIARLVRDLDSDDFVTRENAAKQLDRLGQQAVPALRQALSGSPSLEARRRAEGLLEKWQPLVLKGDGLRLVRAVELLELANTAKARQVLRTLAEGDPGARQTRDARASLERLDKWASARP
jgi:hypothetical protein